MSALQVGRRGNKSVERRGGNLCDSEERLKEVSRGGGSKSEREERKTTRQGKTPLPAGYFTLLVSSRGNASERGLFSQRRRMVSSADLAVLFLALMGSLGSLNYVQG